jgi:hypothetical protein
MKTSLFCLLTLILCVGETIAQDAGNQSQPRRLTYEEVLKRWDRSRAYGDPRDLKTFSQDMVTLRQTGDQKDDFSEGLRDGPFIRFYARSEQIFGDATVPLMIGAVIGIILLAYRFLLSPIQRASAAKGEGLEVSPANDNIKKPIGWADGFSFFVSGSPSSAQCLPSPSFPRAPSPTFNGCGALS